MTPETPTPEADAEYKEAQDFERSALVEPLEKFRKLERERDAARAENAAMREAIVEASEALKELRSFYLDMTGLPPCAANAALAKLKPLIPNGPHPKP
jgi:hypothetical protein